MKTLLLAVLAIWIVTGVGWTILGRFSALRSRYPERFLYGAALGLGIAAYGVYFLGLVGLLSFWPITVWWLALLAVGARNTKAMLWALLRYLNALRKHRFTAESVFPALCLMALAFCGASAALVCFYPPTGGQWDALAYHLADPKIFLLMGRVATLPTEHHSNFPFTLEMLFTVGLLYSGYPLANLFHWLTGALTVGAIWVFCRRHLSIKAGWIAALLFTTTPVVLWEASVAYVELGLGLFATLSAFCALETLDNEKGDLRTRTEWVVLAGLLMGFALGMKYLALVPFVLTGGLLLIGRYQARQVAIYCGLALLIGSPWYIKNTLVMRNPVYPFYHSLFPSSRYWSADRAAGYQAEQKSFGYSSSLKQPAEAVRNLIQVPWRLLANSDRYSNRGEYTFSAWIGGLYAAFVFALLLQTGIPRRVHLLLLLALFQIAIWFVVAQVGRYLVSILPLLAVVSGYSATRLMQTGSEPLTAASRGLVGVALVGQVGMLLYGILILPMSARVAIEHNVIPTAFSVPDTIKMLLDPDGKEKLLQRMTEIYGPMTWINKNAPEDAQVVLYDDARGFYLDRLYLWGNRQHSSYIPYDSMQNGVELTRWMQERRIRYALINLNWTPDAYRAAMSVPPRGVELEALQKWYVEYQGGGEAWRKLLADAIQNGLWVPVYQEKGVVVLEIRAEETQSSRAFPVPAPTQCIEVRS